MRAADPDVDVVLAEATQTWFPGVAEFNDLARRRREPTRRPAGSQVVVATTASSYDKDDDTWDTSHPNARGEVKIAAAVADGLSEVGVGPPAVRPLPDVPSDRGAAPRSAPSPATASSTLTWTGPPGATAQYVWGRDATSGERWRRLPVPGDRWRPGRRTSSPTDTATGTGCSR